MKLYTNTGGFVIAGEVPPFMEGQEADVLIWGDRVFGLERADGWPVRDRDGELRYREVFAVALVRTLA